jgi:hypothetical protein
MVNGKHGHLFFNDNEHIINNIRADPEYRGANAAIRRQLEAELQAIHDMNRTTYEPQQTVLSNNEPTVNHTFTDWAEPYCICCWSRVGLIFLS